VLPVVWPPFLSAHAGRRMRLRTRPSLTRGKWNFWFICEQAQN